MRVVLCNSKKIQNTHLGTPSNRSEESYQRLVLPTRKNCKYKLEQFNSASEVQKITLSPEENTSYINDKDILKALNHIRACFLSLHQTKRHTIN